MFLTSLMVASKPILLLSQIGFVFDFTDNFLDNHVAPRYALREGYPLFF